MDNIYKNIEEYNPNKQWKKLIVFDDIIADMFSNKKLNPIKTELFIRGREFKYMSCFYYTILFCCFKKYYTKFNTLFCYENSKETRTSTNCFNHSSNIVFQDFINLYKKSTAELYCFLVIDNTPPSDNSLRIRKS